jgi:hypothetical protein
MNVQFNDEIVFKKMAATGLDCIFDGKTSEAECIFSAVLAIKPEHQASILGMSVLNASSKSLNTESLKKSVNESCYLNTDNSILWCVQALALLQRKETVFANELLDRITECNDPIARDLAKTIIKNEIRGII